MCEDNYVVGAVAGIFGKKSSSKSSAIFSGASNSKSKLSFVPAYTEYNAAAKFRNAIQHTSNVSEDPVNAEEDAGENAVESGAEQRISFKSKYDPTQRVPKREFNLPKPRSEQEDALTIFIGNLDTATQKTELKKLFSLGKKDTIRFRSIPVKGPQHSKKLEAIRKNFHEERCTMNAYIKFSSEAKMADALALNGEMFKGRHLIVDRASKADQKQDRKKAVFIGNLHFEAEEEDLHALFSECGTIQSVRVIRDQVSRTGKGFAYVNFQDSSSAALALTFDGKEYKGRELRVKRCVKKQKEVSKTAKPEPKGPRFQQSNTTPGQSVVNKKRKFYDLKQEQKLQSEPKEPKKKKLKKKKGFSGLEHGEKMHARKSKKPNKDRMKKKKIIGTLNK